MNWVFRLKYLIVILLCMIMDHTREVIAQETGARTVLWEISGSDLQKPSYLFGTIHVIPKDKFVSYKKADQKLRESEQLVLEMEIDVPIKTQMDWAGKLLLPEGKTISDFMEKEDFARLKSYVLDSLNVKKFLFNTYIKMKPFAFYSALIPHVIGKKIEGYDMYFSDIAKKEGIPVTGLEDFEFQLSIFDSISNEQQLDMFFSGKLDLDVQMEEMLQMYLSHDIYSMAESLNEDMDEYASFENAVLIQRNKNWIEKIPSMIREKSSFIAVGAGHLAGENGLINLLQEKGYRVKPIILNEN